MTKRQIKDMIKISSVVFVEMMAFVINVIIVMACILVLIIYNIYASHNYLDTEWLSPIEMMKDLYNAESEFYKFLKLKLNIMKNRLSQLA